MKNLRGVLAGACFVLGGLAGQAVGQPAEVLEQALELSAYPAPAATPNEVLIRNATIWTQEPVGILIETDLRIWNGKIAEIGQGLQAGPDALVIEAQGRHLTPGLIDCHSHAATEGFGLNEGASSVTSEVRIADVLEPDNRFIYLGVSGGLTAANVLHGSANSIGGQNAVIKMRWGARYPEELLIDTAPPGIKFALGENPTQSNFPALPGVPRRYPQTRMGVAATIRNAFEEARRYREQWHYYDSLSSEQQQRRVPPRRDLRLEALVEILEGRRLVHSHSYRADEILMLIRLAEQLGFKVSTFQHVLEGYRVADEMAAHGAGGSTFSDWWSYKLEAYEAIPYNAAIMHRRGVLASLNSDNPNLARRMNLEAAKALRYGDLSRQEALALVTINPARQLEIAGRTGSLAAGKDADVVIWNGDPLSVYSSADYTFVDGKMVFSRDADQAHREAYGRAREQLVEAIRSEGKTVEKEAPAEGEEISGREEGETGETAPAPLETAFINPAAPPLEYAYSAFANSEPVAIVGADVHTMDGDAISNGVVVFENGKITAVGGPDTPVPPNARRVEAAGKHLWPGLIQMQSVLGLSEINSVQGSVDEAEMGDWNADVDAIVALHPASTHIPVTRSGGVTHAVVAPEGGLVAGNAALIRMDGWTSEEMAAVPRHSLVIRWPGGSTSPFAFFFGQSQSLEERKKEADKKVKELDEFFDDARLYGIAKAEAERTGRPWRLDPQFEALQPVLASQRPLYVVAGADWAIERALEWAAERQLRLIIVGGRDAWKIADKLARQQVPVVLTDVTGTPAGDEPYDVTYTVAAKLDQAGVLVAIAGSDGAGGSSNSRNIPFFAGVAAAFGLDREAAYRSLTLNPARMLGLESALGSITPGKSASLVLTDGDLLEPGTHVEQVWIDGTQPSMLDKHKELYQRYSNRPRPGGR